MINDISEKLKVTSILVSHDSLDILSWAERILVMKDGQLIQEGTPEQIYKQPVNEYCAGLFGEYNVINSENASFLTSISGISLNGKKLLIRPESLGFVKAGNDALSGTVKNILFWGSYYTIDVLVAHQLIRVKTNCHQFAEGDTVYISLSAENSWFI